MTKKALFTGCSITAGSGWAVSEEGKELLTVAKQHPKLWVNLCYQNIKKLNNYELINIGQPGASNTEIFENTIDYIAKFGSQIDVLFCQWTSMPRYNFNVGLELWDTSESVDIRRSMIHDIKLSDGIQYSRNYVQDLLTRIRTMHHLHWEILKVVRYASIISTLSKNIGIKNVFHINGICPWDKNYFVELTDASPEQYTNFTKTAILNIDSRDDKDIYTLYQQIHKQYKEAGGINESQWINLYQSFYNEMVDTNFDNLHPGTKSNELFYQIIRSRLTQLNFN